MRQALLAWENGAGRGHFTSLKTMAESLTGEFEIHAALCSMKYAAEMRPLCVDVFQGPWLIYDLTERKAAGGPGSATWGEYLGDLGYRNPEFLSNQIARYQREMTSRKIDLVITDWAPSALLAARGLGIPAVDTGIGYTVAPYDLPEFPILLPQYVRRIHDEKQMVAAVNEAGGPLGVPAIEHLPAIYTCNDQLVRTLAMLDPYADLRTSDYLPAAQDLPSLIAPTGDEVFVYFSSGEAETPEIMNAIADLGVPTRAYIPGITPEWAAKLTQGGVILERGPVKPELIGLRSRLMVNSAQHGTACMGIGLGLPQVAFPQQMEQAYNAQRAGDYGIMRSSQKWKVTDLDVKAMILEAYHDEAMAKFARWTAAELRPDLIRDTRKMIRERLSPIID
jgi:hypothetical protein